MSNKELRDKMMREFRNKEFIIEYPADKPVKEIILGSPDIPDTDSENNQVVIQ